MAKIVTAEGSYRVSPETFKHLMRFRVRDPLEDMVYGPNEWFIEFDTVEEMNQAGREVLVIHALDFTPRGDSND